MRSLPSSTSHHRKQNTRCLRKKRATFLENRLCFSENLHPFSSFFARKETHLLFQKENYYCSLFPLADFLRITPQKTTALARCPCCPQPQSPPILRKSILHHPKASAPHYKIMFFDFIAFIEAAVTHLRKSSKIAKMKAMNAKNTNF